MTKYQQGDVLLVKVEVVSSFLTSSVEENVIVADGELTGHAHRFRDSSVKTFRRGKDLRFLQLDRPSVLTHEEHNPIEIPPGIYQVRGVREFDHIAQRARRVID